MLNKKPSQELVLSLMAQTFDGRRKIIYEGKGIDEILEQFPSFEIPSVVSGINIQFLLSFLFNQLEQEAELVIKKKSLFQLFTIEWKDKWVPAIITYSKSSIKRR